MAGVENSKFIALSGPYVHGFRELVAVIAAAEISTRTERQTNRQCTDGRDAAVLCGVGA